MPYWVMSSARPSRTSRAASSPAQLKNTSGGSEPASATWMVGLVGLVRKLLEDDVHVRMGLLVLRRRHGDVLRIPHIGEVPHLDVDRLSRADGGGGEPERESAAQRKAQQSSRQFMHGFSSQRSCRQWRTIPPFSIPPNRFVIVAPALAPPIIEPVRCRHVSHATRQPVKGAIVRERRNAGPRHPGWWRGFLREDGELRDRTCGLVRSVRCS